MYKNDRVTRRYSEPFKLKILSELSTGKSEKVNECHIICLEKTRIGGSFMLKYVKGVKFGVNGFSGLPKPFI